MFMWLSKGRVKIKMNEMFKTSLVVVGGLTLFLTIFVLASAGMNYVSDMPLQKFCESHDMKHGFTNSHPFSKQDFCIDENNNSYLIIMYDGDMILGDKKLK